MKKYVIYEFLPASRRIKRRIYQRRLFANDSAVQAEVDRLNDVSSSLPVERRIRYSYAAA